MAVLLRIILVLASLVSRGLAAQQHFAHRAVAESIRTTLGLVHQQGVGIATNRIPALADFSNLLAGPTNPTPASFAAGFSSFAVLQREPATAAVYGMPGSPFTLPATVQVNVTSTRGDYTRSYEAEVTKTTTHGEWKVVLDSKPAGGDYTITAACTSGCANSSSTVIEHVTFGDLWFCAGQSNMQLIMRHTFSRNDTIAALAAGKYNNLRVYQHPNIASATPIYVQPPKMRPAAGTMDLSMRWNRASDAARYLKLYNRSKISGSDLFHPGANQSVLMDYGGICMYFGVALTDKLRAQRRAESNNSESDDVDVPLGLMDVSWGGTMIEHWSTNETTALCKNTSVTKMNGMLYNGIVAPFLNMSVTGWLW